MTAAATADPAPASQAAAATNPPIKLNEAIHPPGRIASLYHLILWRAIVKITGIAVATKLFHSDFGDCRTLTAQINALRQIIAIYLHTA